MSGREEIRARLVGRVQVGPWTVNDEERTVRADSGEIIYDRSADDAHDWVWSFSDTAEFIAHAPEDIATLLDLVDELKSMSYEYIEDESKDFAAGYNHALEMMSAVIEMRLA